MQTVIAGNTVRLAELLTEALALADTLNLPIAAIHIDEALSYLADNSPAGFTMDAISSMEIVTG